MRTQSNNMYYGMSTNKRRSRDASVNGGDTVEIHARAIYPDRRGRLSPDSENQGRFMRNLQVVPFSG